MIAVISTLPDTAPDVRGRSVAAGAGSLRISRGQAGSVVSTAFAASPLRLLTPRNHGTAAWIYTSTFGGGLVDGDAVRLRIDVDAGAAAFISSQASTKVYRSVSGHAAAHVDAAVGGGALLIVAPDPTVCFSRSRYEQTQQFAVDGTGGLVLVDWFTSGRHGSGERWAFEKYSSRTAIHRDGRLAWYDAVLLDPIDGPISARMGRCNVLATIAALGARVDAHATRTLDRMSDAPLRRRDHVVVAGSAIAGGGCVIRIAGASVEDVGREIRRCLAFAPDLLGDDPWARRW
jgi:urease accessory protein